MRKGRKIIRVVGCARCGGTHPNLVFRRLTVPAKEFQWFAICPKTKEPILMNVIAKVAP